MQGTKLEVREKFDDAIDEICNMPMTETALGGLIIMASSGTLIIETMPPVATMVVILAGAFGAALSAHGVWRQWQDWEDNRDTTNRPDEKTKSFIPDNPNASDFNGKNDLDWQPPLLN